ncbi:cytosolic phospholipase A2 zeta [Hortaea werneckii]|nr:cytosolic phospholipase A2 zeta [Hortaea werneckii]
MRRTLRWLQLGGRQREFALTVALGCSTAALYSAYQRKPLYADAGNATGSWNGKSAIVSSDDPPRASGKESQRTTTATLKDRLVKGPLDPEPPPPPTKGHSVFDAEGDSPSDPLQAWQYATERVAAASGNFTNFDTTSLREKIKGLLVPKWIRQLPDWMNKLQNELSMAPWSLSWEIWEEAHDPEVNPEIIWDARVRVGQDLCQEEQAFLKKRQRSTARALAKYIGVPESEVHPEDVPTIGICGSGGGLRALVAGSSSYQAAAEDGLFDCVTYTAGVSGSCWLQTLYYSSIGRQNFLRIINHLKDRTQVHIAYPPALLGALSQAPTNKYLLSGFVEKLRGVPDADFGLVDIYGLALAARLLVPRGGLRVSAYDLKVSNQGFYTDRGTQPLPIYTAVRHEIPDAVGDVERLAKEARFTTKHYDYFQWFEWTPYEFYSEELDAGIPTWAVGRKWQNGDCIWRDNGLALPELKIPLMMGIWGSAFCATLSHYYKEIRPILKSSGMSGLDTLIAGKNEDLSKVHPIDPAVIPNYVLGMRDRLPKTAPESLHSASHLQLMDAGMANNLPIYPLLRPGRDVDVIIAFDASADVKGDNWIRVVDGYARQRNIKGWPMGAGWPPQSNTQHQTVLELEDAQENAPARVKRKLTPSERERQDPPDLGYCTVWAGSKEERQEYMDEPVPRQIESPDDDWHLTSPNAGIAVIYYPFMANKKVPGVDPMESDFLSTWNFVYTPDQIDKCVALARANYEEGREQTKRTIRAVWERKRALRLQREEEAHEFAKSWRVKRGTAHLRRNGDVGQGDQFT